MSDWPASGGGEGEELMIINARFCREEKGKPILKLRETAGGQGKCDEIPQPGKNKSRHVGQLSTIEREGTGES